MVIDHYRDWPLRNTDGYTDGNANSYTYSDADSNTDSNSNPNRITDTMHRRYDGELYGTCSSYP